MFASINSLPSMVGSEWSVSASPLCASLQCPRARIRVYVQTMCAHSTSIILSSHQEHGCTHSCASAGPTDDGATSAGSAGHVPQWCLGAGPAQSTGDLAACP
eukprot:1157346-Pelagomonas_calceolata.AAC.8